jgi:DNA-binding NarL/FixJ family response regulator
MRCLIVDDSAPFLRVAESRLSREGIDVVAVATTFAEALREAERLRPDVALVDVSLGEKNGFDLSRELADRFGIGLQIVLISTRAEEDLAELIAASPVVGFIPKSSLSPSALLELVTET